MASTASPYGFKPVNEVGGLPYAGSTRSFVLNPAGYGTNIFNGSLVYVATTGYLQLVTADGSDGTTNAFPAGTTLTGAVGVFVGCSYVNAQGQTVFAQYFPGGTTAPTGTTIQAYVADDPDQLFKVALVAGQTEDGNGLTIAFLGRTVIGSNLELVQNAGSTVTGDSKIGAYSSAGGTTTASLPLRCVDVVPDTANSSGNFCEVIVKWNAPYIVSTSTSSGGITTTTDSVVTGGHQYLNPLGV